MSALFQTPEAFWEATRQELGRLQPTEDPFLYRKGSFDKIIKIGSPVGKLVSIIISATGRKSILDPVQSISWVEVDKE